MCRGVIGCTNHSIVLDHLIGYGFQVVSDIVIRGLRGKRCASALHMCFIIGHAIGARVAVCLLWFGVDELLGVIPLGTDPAYLLVNIMSISMAA